MHVAVFGLGIQEILVLAVIGLTLVAVTVVVVGLLLVLRRRSPDAARGELAALRRENAELRDEIERLKSDATPTAPPPQDPTGIRKPQ